MDRHQVHAVAARSLPVQSSAPVNTSACHSGVIHLAGAMIDHPWSGEAARPSRRTSSTGQPAAAGASKFLQAATPLPAQGPRPGTSPALCIGTSPSLSSTPLLLPAEARAPSPAPPCSAAAAPSCSVCTANLGRSTAAPLKRPLAPWRCGCRLPGISPSDDSRGPHPKRASCLMRLRSDSTRSPRSGGGHAGAAAASPARALPRRHNAAAPSDQSPAQCSAVDGGCAWWLRASSLGYPCIAPRAPAG